MKKKVYFVIMIISLIILIFSGYVFLKEKSTYKSYVNQLKNSSYKCQIKFYNDNNDVGDNIDVSIIYNYKNNIEEYMSDVSYQYKDFNNNKLYQLVNGRYEVLDLFELSISDRLNDLLSRSKVLKKNNKKYEIRVDNLKLEKFIKSFDIIKYDKNDKYKITLKIENNNITEVYLYSSKTKYLKFVFMDINEIGDIVLPNN